MIGNYINYKDNNNNMYNAKVIDKVLITDDNGILRTAYLCSYNLNITIVYPEQIKKVL